MARPSSRRPSLAMALALLVSTLMMTRVDARGLVASSSSSSSSSPLNEDSAACESCLVFGHIVYDAVGDPYVETKLAEYLITSICPNFDDKESCKANVNNLVEALVAWMRANLEPEDLCSQYGICPAAPSARRHSPPLDGPASLLRALASASSLPSATPKTTTNGAKDVTCPLCMFVLTKIKDALSDPITREKVHDAGLKACASLPGGDAAKSIRDTCVEFVERNESEIYELIDASEPADLCEQLKACAPAPPSSAAMMRLQALMRAVLPSPMLPMLLGPSSSSSNPSSSSSAASMLGPALARLTDGQCDACLEVVKDIHRAIASPETQDQATAMAKEACDALPSAAADLKLQCKEGVDQYAPLVFGMALAYLQPSTLCAQVGMCPAPQPPSSSVVWTISNGQGAAGWASVSRREEEENADAAAIREIEASIAETLQRVAEAVMQGLMPGTTTTWVLEEVASGEEPQEEAEEQEERAPVAVAAS